MKHKKGFTLIEVIIVIGILAVIAGVFAVNMVRTLNKNKEEEKNSMASTVNSAADMYLSQHPETFKDLYEDKGYVDITVGKLKESGLISDELKNPETGALVDNNEVIRARLDSNDVIHFIYPLTEEEKNKNSWSMHANPIHIKYKDYNGTMTQTEWCTTQALKDWGTHNLFIEDKDANRYSGSYDAFHLNVPIEGCNVNPQIAGTYQVTYQYTDIETKAEKTYIRQVYVEASDKDVMSIEAIINPIIAEDGKTSVASPIILGATNVPIYIKEIYKDGTTNTFSANENTLGNYEYNIENFNTSRVNVNDGNEENNIAIISSKKTNSDGSKPKSINVRYDVSTNIKDFIMSSTDCVKNSTGCTFVGLTEANHIKYAGLDFRIISIDGNNIKLIYDGDYVTGPYGQLGNCVSSCCNNGRYAYVSIGDSGYNFTNTMDKYLDNFANKLNSTKLKSQTFTAHVNDTDYSLRTNNHIYDNAINVSHGLSAKVATKKVLLLTREEYKTIAECTSNTYCKSSKNYITAKPGAFWLLDFYQVQFGVGAYNEGRNEARVYHYYVNDNGTLSTGGAYSAQGRYDVQTETHGVRPTIVLQNPELVSGNGSAKIPYVIG